MSGYKIPMNFGAPLRFATLAALFLALAGCGTGAPSYDGVSGFGEATQGGIAEYRLGVSDRMRIAVYGEPQLSMEYTVSEKGTVSLALVGDIQAAGLTVSEFRESLEQQLSEGFLNEPRVSVEIIQYRPYYILGEVERAGEYPYTGDLTVLKAVAIAGGYTYRANKSVVFIKRGGALSEQKIKLSQELRVYPGDIVRIGERFF